MQTNEYPYVGNKWQRETVKRSFSTKVSNTISSLLEMEETEVENDMSL